MVESQNSVSIRTEQQGELLAELWDLRLDGQRPSEVGIQYFHKELFKGSWTNWAAEKIGGCLVAWEKKKHLYNDLTGWAQGRMSQCP